MTFEAAFQKLEKQFKRMVKEENEKYGAKGVFLPNVAPLGPVDFVLIGAEPSRGSWARTDEEAREKIAKGFRNFGGCLHCEPLHYCVDEFLCRRSGSYYLTDLAKGAVSGTVSWREGMQKYERWYGLLLEELKLVAKPNAIIISIGDRAAGFLVQRGLRGHIGKIPHYSGRSRNLGKMAEAFPCQWKSFLSAPLELPSGKTVSEAKKRWMFDYKILFERFRPGGHADWRPSQEVAVVGTSSSLRPPCASCEA